MSNQKLKASQIIDESCCGQGLPIDCTKPKLVEKVKKLERDKFVLIIAVCLMISCFYIMVPW